jgi:hypothetical protein
MIVDFCWAIFVMTITQKLRCNFLAFNMSTQTNLYMLLSLKSNQITATKIIHVCISLESMVNCIRRPLSSSKLRMKPLIKSNNSNKLRLPLIEFFFKNKFKLFITLLKIISLLDLVYFFSLFLFFA